MLLSDTLSCFSSLLVVYCYYWLQDSKYRISRSYRMGAFHIGYRGRIGDKRAYQAFISDTIYNEIL